MKDSILFIGLAALLLCGCAKDNDLQVSDNRVAQGYAALESTPSDDEAAQKMKIMLRVGETVVVKPYGLTVTFFGISEDSRCPTDVTCFWEGRAVAKFSFERKQRQAVVALATPNSQPDPPNAASVLGFKVELADIAPDPVSTATIPSSRYMATLAIEAGGSVDGDN